MKKLFLSSVVFAGFAAGPILAADMPVKARPAPAAVVASNWNGFYVGINGGYGWSANNDDVLLNETFGGAPFASTSFPSRDMKGGFFGGQLGYNWQISSFVLGIEGDIQWSGIKGHSVATLPYLGVATQTLDNSGDLKWFGSIRGRLGWLVTPDVLVYGTGGYAFGNVEYSLVWRDSLGFSAAGSTERKSGWTAGGGFEWMFAPHSSFKVEYQYLNFGSATINAQEFFGGVETLFAVHSDVDHATFHTVRLGLNHHF